MEFDITNGVLKRVSSLKYLGLTTSKDGELEGEVEKRRQGGWRSWKKLLSVLCNRRTSSKKSESAY